VVAKNAAKEFRRSGRGAKSSQVVIGREEVLEESGHQFSVVRRLAGSPVSPRKNPARGSTM